MQHLSLKIFSFKTDNSQHHYTEVNAVYANSPYFVKMIHHLGLGVESIFVGSIYKILMYSKLLYLMFMPPKVIYFQKPPY